MTGSSGSSTCDWRWGCRINVLGDGSGDGSACRCTHIVVQTAFLPALCCCKVTGTGEKWLTVLVDTDGKHHPGLALHSAKASECMMAMHAASSVASECW